jgi:ariadne-1
LKKTGNLSKDEKKRDEAKNELDKYMFYFERFNNHDKSEKHARTLRPIIKTKIELLHNIKKYPLGELEFLEEAINEVIKCR